VNGESVAPHIESDDCDDCDGAMCGGDIPLIVGASDDDDGGGGDSPDAVVLCDAIIVLDWMLII